MVSSSHNYQQGVVQAQTERLARLFAEHESQRKSKGHVWITWCSSPSWRPYVPSAIPPPQQAFTDSKVNLFFKPNRQYAPREVILVPYGIFKPAAERIRGLCIPTPEDDSSALAPEKYMYAMQGGGVILVYCSLQNGEEKRIDKGKRRLQRRLAEHLSKEGKPIPIHLRNLDSYLQRVESVQFIAGRRGVLEHLALKVDLPRFPIKRQHYPDLNRPPSSAMREREERIKRILEGE